MKAKKDNKIYQIEGSAQKDRYLREGFDIYDDDGKLLEYSPSKKIPYAEYDRLKKENEELKKQLSEIREVGKTKGAKKAGE